jgi:hypothetical protein
VAKLNGLDGFAEKPKDYAQKGDNLKTIRICNNKDFFSTNRRH